MRTLNSSEEYEVAGGGDTVIDCTAAVAGVAAAVAACTDPATTLGCVAAVGLASAAVAACATDLDSSVASDPCGCACGCGCGCGG